MATSTGVKSGIARHGRALISIIIFQLLLIVWLASWVVGDYLNNDYVRAYVNNTIQADSWLIGTLALVGIVGSSAGLVLQRKKHATKTQGMVSTRTRIPRPTLTITPAKSTTQPLVSSKTIAQPTTASASSKPSSELHPAVAALKADLSEARLSLGLASVTAGTQGSTVPASPTSAKFEDSKPSLTTQSTPIQHPPAFTTSSQPMTTKPTLTIQTTPAQHPPTNSQASQQTTTNPNPQTISSRPIPPTVIRPLAPPSPSTPTSNGQTSPLSKAASGTPPTPRPVGLLPRSETPPATAKDVSTVITGITPAQQQQKKKDPEPAKGQTSSQKQN